MEGYYAEKTWSVFESHSINTFCERNVPSSISELLTARNSNYNLRGDAILKLPKVNSTKYGIKSWRYQAARLWNTIPNNLRNIDTYRSFKRGLKELDLVGL